MGRTIYGWPPTTQLLRSAAADLAKQSRAPVNESPLERFSAPIDSVGFPCGEFVIHPAGWEEAASRDGMSTFAGFAGPVGIVD